MKRNIDDVLRLFKAIMNDSFAKSGDTIDEDKTPYDISKISYDELIDSTLGEFSIFLKSTSRATNNKPFKYKHKISGKKFYDLLECKEVLRESKEVEGDIFDLIDNNNSISKKHERMTDEKDNEDKRGYTQSTNDDEGRTGNEESGRSDRVFTEKPEVDNDWGDIVDQYEHLTIEGAELPSGLSRDRLRLEVSNMMDRSSYTEGSAVHYAIEDFKSKETK